MLPRQLKASIQQITLASLMLALCACSSIGDMKDDFSERFFGKPSSTPPADLVDFKPTAIPKIIWNTQVGNAAAFEFTPTIDKDIIYAGSATGEITKIDALTGRQLWRVSAGKKLTGGVGAGQGLVFAGLENGELGAYEQAAGKLLWKSQLSSLVLSAAKIADNVVVVRTNDSKIYGLDAADGKRKWVYERNAPVLALRNSAGLVVDAGVAYAGFSGGKLVAITIADGKLIWEANVGQPKGKTEIERITDVTSLPVVDGSLIYAVAYQGKVVAVDRSTGRPAWDRDISSYAGLNAEDARVFISHSGGAVYALDYNTGKTYWRQADLKNRQLTAPLPMGSAIAVGDLEGYVHFLAREDGALVARIRTDSNAVMSQMVALSAKRLLLQTRNGGLYAIELN